MSATRIPPTLYTKLQIINPPEKDKHVAFTDLNEVRTFYYHEVPARVSKLSREALLQNRVEYLEQKIARMTKQKEGSRMALITPSHSDTCSQVSVTSPYTPGNVEKLQQPSTPKTQAVWKTPDIQLAHPPANVVRAIASSHATSPTPPTKPSKFPSTQTPPPPIPSIKRRIISGLGAFLAGPGMVAGFFSILPLGPIGLGVTAGILGAGLLLMWAGSKMK